jgi:3-dehydroquinate synthase
MENCVPNLIHCNNIAEVNSYLPNNCRVITIVDPVVDSLYGKYLPEPRIVVEASEKSKSMRKIEEIALKLLDMGADREVFLLAAGGGIITDFAGFLASIYMRGVRFGFIPTTLLSQVDAAIGGKNAVNLEGYKNILGVFRKPEFTLICPEFLKSLPEKELKAGMSELLKTFLISERDCFFSVADTVEKKGYNIEMLSEWIIKASEIKFSITERDPYDMGERQLLNLGHTFAHSLEKVCGIPHGEAVSIGIKIAVSLSVKLGMLSSSEANAIFSGLKKCGLKTELPFPASSLAEAMVKDKKKSGETIRFILLESAGKAVIYPLEINKLDKYLYDLS